MQSSSKNLKGYEPVMDTMESIGCSEDTVPFWAFCVENHARTLGPDYTFALKFGCAELNDGEEQNEYLIAETADITLMDGAMFGQLTSADRSYYTLSINLLKDAKAKNLKRIEAQSKLYGMMVNTLDDSYKEVARDLPDGQRGSPGALLDQIHVRWRRTGSEKRAECLALLNEAQIDPRDLSNPKAFFAKVAELERTCKLAGHARTEAEKVARIHLAVAIDNQGQETGIANNLLILQDLPTAQTVIGLTTSLCKSLPKCAKAQLLANQASTKGKKKSRANAQVAVVAALKAEIVSLKRGFGSKELNPNDYGPVRDCERCGRKNVTHTLAACRGPGKSTKPSRKKLKKAFAATVAEEEDATVYAMCVDSCAPDAAVEDPCVNLGVLNALVTDPTELDELILIAQRQKQSKPLAKRLSKKWTTRYDAFRRKDYRDHREERGRQTELALASGVESMNIDTFSSYSSTLILDSGATAHLIGENLEKFFHPETSGDFATLNLSIECAGGMKLPASRKGTLILHTKTSKIFISDVILVPGLKKNLISTRALMKKGFKVIFEGEYAEITNKNDSSFKLLAKEQKDGLFHLEGELEPYCQLDDQALFAKLKDQNCLDLYHLRFGHLSFGYIEKAVEKNLVTELNVPINFKKDIINPFCQDCEQGKAHDKHGSGLTRDRKYSNGEKFHTDLCGPLPVQSRRGNKYFQTIVDDTSNYCHLFFLRHKSEFFENFIIFDKMIFNRYGRHVKVIRHDQAKEMMSKKFIAYCAEHGIETTPTNVYSSWENSVAERKNLTLANSARSMLATAQLAKHYWEDAIATACYIQNRSPHRSNPGWATPFQMRESRLPSIAHFRVFGCKAMVKVPTPKVKDKLSPRAELCTFVGYSNQGTTVSWRFVTSKGTYFTSGNAKFNELPLVAKLRNSEVERENGLNEREYSDLFDPVAETSECVDDSLKRKSELFDNSQNKQRKLIPNETCKRITRSQSTLLDSSLSSEQGLSTDKRDESIEFVNPFVCSPTVPRREIAEAREDEEWLVKPAPVIGKSNYDVASQPGLESRKRVRFDGSIVGTKNASRITTQHELEPQTKSVKILNHTMTPLQNQLIPDCGLDQGKGRIVNPDEAKFHKLLAYYLSETPQEDC
jgi:hypothetical protein